MIELNFVWIALLLIPAMVLLVRQARVHHKLSAGYMPISSPIVIMCVSLMLFLVTSWIL